MVGLIQKVGSGTNFEHRQFLINAALFLLSDPREALLRVNLRSKSSQSPTVIPPSRPAAGTIRYQLNYGQLGGICFR